MFFNHHPFFQTTIRQLTDQQFHDYLVQVACFSSHYVPWLAKARSGLQGEECKEIISSIIQDEVPKGRPSHAEDRIHDMGVVGIPEQIAINPNLLATTDTRDELSKLFGMIDSQAGNKFNDLRIMTVVRIAGEILVGETYRHVVPELKRRFGLDPKNSHFYAPHFEHDIKSASEGHAAVFNKVLQQMIISDESLIVANGMASCATGVRQRLHHQFLPGWNVAV